MDKPLKVSDPSQPFKFVVAAVFAVLLVLILLAVKDLKQESNLGFSTTTSQSTTSTVAVVGSSSTLIVATSTGPHFICNTGINLAYVAFAPSVSTSTKPGSTDSNGMEFATGTAATACQGPFDFIGVHAAHTKTGTTSIEITVFP